MPDSIQLILQRRFDALRARNPRFSLRAYAKRLDVHPAALCEILQGKRNVSTKLATRMAAGTVLEEADRESLIHLAAGARLPVAKRETTRLALDQYFIVSEWHYYAILSLGETREFRATSTYVAKRLGISRDVARAALERLERVGYFTRDARGRLMLKPKFSLATAEDVVSAALRRRHAANFEAASAALESVSVDKREMTFMTMAIDPQKLPEAKRLVREFRDKLCAFMEDGARSEVYEFCLTLFPRTIVALLLVLATACSPVAPPSPVPQEIQDGHSGGNGGDLVRPEDGVAWFLGSDKVIETCLEVAPDFGLEAPALRKEVESTLAVWTEYIEKKKIYFATGDKYLRPTFPSKLHWREKCGGEHLKFYFGVMADEVKRDLRGGPERLAFAVPRPYDRKAKWGGGYVWLAPPKSIAPDANFPDWTLVGRLHGMLMHEWGHILGCGHVPGTIMDAKYAETLRAIASADHDDAVPTFVLYGIDQNRELYLCRFCNSEYRGNAPWYDVFPKLLGRERRDPAYATVTFGFHEGEATVEMVIHEGKDQTKVPFTISLNGSRTFPTTLPIFKIADIRKVFQANGGEGAVYWGAFAGHPVLIQFNMGFDYSNRGPESFDFFKWTMPFQIQGDIPTFQGKTLFEAHRVP